MGARNANEVRSCLSAFKSFSSIARTGLNIEQKLRKLVELSAKKWGKKYAVYLLGSVKARAVK